MEERYREKLLSTFKAFASLCEAKGLRWFLAFGSAIGAVREGGIIPWDDDIDVYMPREDFQKLLSAPSPEGFEILHFSTSPLPLPYTYAKFCDASSTIWEQQKYPCVIGVFIDIFPLDEVWSEEASRRRKAFTMRLVAYKRGIRRTSFANWLRSSLRDKLAAAGDLFCFRPLASRSRRLLLEADAAAASETGDRYIVYDNIYPDAKVIYDKSLFEGEPVEAMFEGMRVPLPNGNDALLRQIYGNYMTPPPKAGRISGHHHFFMDMDRRLDLDDIERSHP